MKQISLLIAICVLFSACGTSDSINKESQELNKFYDKKVNIGKNSVIAKELNINNY